MERQKIVHNKILDYAYSQELCIYKDSHASIYKGHHIPSSELALVKIVDIKQMKQEQLAQYINNLKTFKALDHENVCRMMDIVNTPNNIFTMYEYHEVNLQQVLAKGKLTEQEGLQLFEQIVSALIYLHNKNIAHRTLSSNNVMIKQGKNGGNLKLKISHPLLNEQASLKTIDYFSSPQNVFKKVIGAKGDIWALGIIYFQLLNGDQQVKATDVEQFQKFVTAPSTYKQMQVSNWSKNMLTKMLVIQPEKRSDITQISQMLRMRGQNSMITYLPIHQQQSSQTKLEQISQLPQKPTTAGIPTSPRQSDLHSHNQYHRSPLKYMNKSPMRRNQSFQNGSKSPLSHRQLPPQISSQQKHKIALYFELALLVQKLLFMFNESKVIYEQAVRITLLALRHFSQIVKQIQNLIEHHRTAITEDQIKLFKACLQKVDHYKSCNPPKMQHDVYFTHILTTGKQSEYQFLNYVQFWLRLAIRHTIDFIEVNKKNMIEKNYLECIYWSYLHALKYYCLLDWLKTERKGSKIPESLVDKFFVERQAVSVETFKLTEEEALRILRI